MLAKEGTDFAADETLDPKTHYQPPPPEQGVNCFHSRAGKVACLASFPTFHFAGTLKPTCAQHFSPFILTCELAAHLAVFFSHLFFTEVHLGSV